MNARLPPLNLPTPGLELRIRPAGAADRPAVARMLDRMDRYGLYQRHFGYGQALNEVLLQRLEAVDGCQRYVVVAENAEGEIIAHGEFVAEGSGAEFALMVLPDWRGMGIARCLLRELMERAATVGHGELRGMIQADNTAMLRLAREQGFDRQAADDPAVVQIVRPLRRAEAWGPGNGDDQGTDSRLNAHRAPDGIAQALA